jgi:hypothetical protein
MLFELFFVSLKRNKKDLMIILIILTQFLVLFNFLMGSNAKNLNFLKYIYFILFYIYVYIVLLYIYIHIYICSSPAHGFRLIIYIYIYIYIYIFLFECML